MVRRTADNGAVWHEPPYTWEEEQALYRGMAMQPGSTILHAPRPGGSSEPSSGSPPPKPAK
jgi:hypothetical protein